MSDWMPCADWLARCDILQRSNKVFSSGANPADLAHTLQDGVLLCFLLNKLKQSAIDLRDFNVRPQTSRFLWTKNIRTFLIGCREHFSLRESDLFEVEHLLDIKDFAKVIDTLSKLSNSHEALSSGIEGFTVTSHSREYYNFEELARDSVDDDDVYGLPSEHNEAEKIYEEIYTDIIYRKQSDVDATPLPAAVERPPAPRSKRDMCIKELFDTENNYVEALTMLIHHFLQPSRHKLPDGDARFIFSGIEALLPIHIGFRNELRNACTVGIPKIGDVFLKWKRKFVIYGQYCSNLLNVQDKVDQLTAPGSAYADFIYDCEFKANGNKFRLRDLLQIPFQRVLKYHLLLEGLIKLTPKHEESEVECLKKAREAMQDIAMYVNEVKRDNEDLNVINDIQRSIVDLEMPPDTRLTDYGRLLKDGEVRLQSHRDQRKKDRVFFLFDKVLLICRSMKADTFSYKDALIMKNFMAEDASSKSRDRAWNFSFNLNEIRDQSNPQDICNVYTIFVRTDDQRKQWITAFSKARSNMMPFGWNSNGHWFQMKSFSEPKECDHCQQLLRGVFYQGYECPACNTIAHKECVHNINTCKPRGRRVSRGDSSKNVMNGVSNRRVPDPNNQVPPIPPRPKRPSLRLPIARLFARQAYDGHPEPPRGKMALIFPFGVEIEILRKDESMWWEGRYDGEEGFFPYSFVGNMSAIVPNRPSSSVICEPNSQRLSQFISHRHTTANDEEAPVDLSSYLWFVGPMSRSVATDCLRVCGCGTYLVRTSTAGDTRGEYAISVVYKGKVKHIRVQRENNGSLWLANDMVFGNIQDLVAHYSLTSLGDNFEIDATTGETLDTTLKIPYKSYRGTAPSQDERNFALPIIGTGIATFDYESTGAMNTLTLRKGARVEIIAKPPRGDGWWKGRLADGSVGYFPSAFITED